MPKRRYIRKYLLSLTPFVFCTILSFIYAAKKPKDFPNPSYPYQTEGALAYLSAGWLIIGIVFTGIFLSILLINDILEWVAKAMKKKGA
jgi:hypothetical protein